MVVVGVEVVVVVIREGGDGDRVTVFFVEEDKVA